MIAGPPSFQRDKPTKAKLAKIKTLNESVNRTNQIILRYKSSSAAGNKLLWLRSIPSTKPDIQRSRFAESRAES